MRLLPAEAQHNQMLITDRTTSHIIKLSSDSSGACWRRWGKVKENLSCLEREGGREVYGNVDGRDLCNTNYSAILLRQNGKYYFKYNNYDYTMTR